MSDDSDDLIDADPVPEAPAGGTVVAEEPEPPVEQDFWKKYNEHLEFPTGWAIAILSHVLIIAVVVFLLGKLQGDNNKRGPKMISLGDDDFGAGSMGGGGQENPIALGELPPDAQIDKPELEKLKDDLQDKLKLENPLDNLQIPDAMAHAYSQLDKELQEKLLGARKGSGTGTGKGDDKSGSGPGGTGSDSTRARGLRWVLRFNTKSGQDYLNQLKALKAVMMIPVPPDNKLMLILRDLGNPRIGVYATDADIAEQAEKIQFQDTRKESNEAIHDALRLPFTPNAFWAFFPRALEDEMSRMETSYQNKKSNQIKETVFQVIVSGGEARLRVVAQKLK